MKPPSLVDANVLSKPTKPRPNKKVVEWLPANERGCKAQYAL